MAQQNGWLRHLDLAVALTTAFIKETEGHTLTREEVLCRLQTKQLTSCPGSLALWARLNKPYPVGLRGRTVSDCSSDDALLAMERVLHRYELLVQAHSSTLWAAASMPPMGRATSHILQPLLP